MKTLLRAVVPFCPFCGITILYLFSPAQVSPLQDQASPLGRDEPFLTTRAHDGLAREIARREEVHPPYSVVGCGAQTCDPAMITNSRVLLTEPGSSSNDYHHATLSAGIIKGDEIMVINGAIVSDLDMMYIESVLQEELALCLMMRSVAVTFSHILIKHTVIPVFCFFFLQICTKNLHSCEPTKTSVLDAVL